MPLPFRLRPVGRVVVADHEVERAAVGEVEDLAEDALAERAPADDRRAEALVQRGGHDLGRARGAAVDQHDDRLARRDLARRLEHPLRPLARPSVVTITPFGTNALDTSTASSSRPPPLRAQVEHEPLRAAALAALASRAPARRAPRCVNDASSSTPSLAARRRGAAPTSTAGTRIRSRRTRSWRVRLPRLRIVSRTYVPGLPLIRAVDTSLDLPAIDLPFTVVITSPGPDAGSLRRRVVEHARDEQAARVLDHGHADAGELAARRLPEQLRSPRGVK